MPERKEPGDRAAWRDLNRYLEIGLMFPASIVAGLLIGYGLDRLFGTEKVFVVIFMLLGIAAAFIQLVRLTSKVK